jgi:predicted Fe-Mo cluster-binding NifX family protein
MKIAVPSMGETIESSVSMTLGRAPFIILYNSETKKYNPNVNPGYKTQDGSGLKAVEIIIQNKADLLITLEIGKKAYPVLLNKKINVHLLSGPGKIKDVLNKFLKNR